MRRKHLKRHAKEEENSQRTRGSGLPIGCSLRGNSEQVLCAPCELLAIVGYSY